MSLGQLQKGEVRNGERSLSATTVAPATLGETPKTPVALNAHMNAQVNAHGKEEDR